MASLRAELSRSHRGFRYRTYRCTRKECDFSLVALDGLTIWCKSPCRSRMRPGRVYPTKRFIEDILSQIDPLLLLK